MQNSKIIVFSWKITGKVRTTMNGWAVCTLPRVPSRDGVMAEILPAFYEPGHAPWYRAAPPRQGTVF